MLSLMKFESLQKSATKIRRMFLLTTDRKTDIQNKSSVKVVWSRSIFLMNVFWLGSGFVNMQLLLISLGHFLS